MMHKSSWRLIGLSIALAVVATWSASATQHANSASRARAESLVGRIVRADYQGDRAGLERLAREMGELPADPEIDLPRMYWRGFAYWRRAINGFNDGTPPAEIESDLQTALQHFDEALAREPAYVEAAIGRVSCGGYLLFLHRNDPARTSALAAAYKPAAEAALRQAPDNPRLAWVLGPSRWYAAAGASESERPGKQAAVIAGYERALAHARAQRKSSADPLAPSWGEPELLMNIAWSHLNKIAPDPRSAEKYAREALAIVPDWRYVRDILLPQILAKK